MTTNFNKFKIVKKVTTKKNKLKELSVTIRKLDNGYLVESYGNFAGPDWKSSAAHQKQFVYGSKEEAFVSAESLLDAFSKDVS